ncbi:MAG: hypothetical protein PWP45_59 [Tepidanaerobacteraceae bacterium]|uniref:DUF3006 domain-containing protein n=1 Tax=Caldanaerovirga acetigignens TaxID=447595 RepID=A0A1M7FHJ0_9FIRM|nr:DUF3006 domain-containing protein [Caldanaerovirga acetigignens]MDN5330834.1 hypothetical protein [Tepidanaerobacteraceae bacterium]SHM03572.1 Protein of unknown function [Caldanaerovirga acetigignens]
MPKKGILDRFEGDFAVIETFDGMTMNIKKRFLPENAREGDVIDLDDLSIDEPLTRQRKEKIRKLAERLFED